MHGNSSEYLGREVTFTFGIAVASICNVSQWKTSSTTTTEQWTNDSALHIGWVYWTTSCVYQPSTASEAKSRSHQRDDT